MNPCFYPPALAALPKKNPKKQKTLLFLICLLIIIVYFKICMVIHKVLLLAVL